MALYDLTWLPSYKDASKTFRFRFIRRLHLSGLSMFEQSV